MIINTFVIDISIIIIIIIDINDDNDTNSSTQFLDPSSWTYNHVSERKRGAPREHAEHMLYCKPLLFMKNYCEI